MPTKSNRSTPGTGGVLIMAKDLGNGTNGLGGQIAIVTGGGRGLGRAFAQALAKAGAIVAITDRTEAELKETLSLIEETGGRATAFTADVTDRSAMAQVVGEVEKTLGPIDILVNNAAVLTPLGYDWEVDLNEWWRSMEINVRGPYLCMQLVLPGMMARRSGRIVNVTSGAAYEIHPYGTVYCTSKAALTQLTNHLAAGVKEYGISVFALAPGGSTAMIEILATSANVPKEINARFQEALVDGGRTQESVQMLMFLLSGQADSLTGRHISHTDSIDELLRRTHEIVQHDLYTLRRHT
jgi:NAD(P)-dependent dehydrogenase (short-subunit alcohol dehydrogenase family)